MSQVGWVKDWKPIASTEIGYGSLSLHMESQILTRCRLTPKFVVDRSTIATLQDLNELPQAFNC